MRLHHLKSVFIFGLILLAITGVTATEVTIFAAASLTDSLKQIASDYEKQSGNKIIFNFGASSTLARQIEEGAPADIFFSADEAKMDALAAKGLIAKETRRSPLSNVLVIVVPKERASVMNSAQDLTNLTIQRIALGDPNTVPKGLYARE